MLDRCIKAVWNGCCHDTSDPKYLICGVVWTFVAVNKSQGRLVVGVLD